MVKNLAEPGNAPGPVQGQREPPTHGRMERSEIASREKPGTSAQVATASMFA